MDVALCLEPLANELERTRESTLIIGHKGMLRFLLVFKTRRCTMRKHPIDHRDSTYSTSLRL